MDRKKNTLTLFMDTYAGPWPKALAYMLFVIFGGQLIAFIVVGEIHLKSLLGSSVVGVGCLIWSVWLKRKYTR